MSDAIHRLSREEPHAYGVTERGSVVAHVWWEGDAQRRGSCGWYVRDLRRPGHVRRLPVDIAIDALARDADRPDEEWAAAAADVARRTSERALAAARRMVARTTHDTYELHVGGIGTAALASEFPALTIRDEGEVKVLTARAVPGELADLLARVRTVGGTVLAVVRVAPRLP